MVKISIINGPNLNLLGKREPDVYGNQSFESYLTILQEAFPNIPLSYFQSNHEGSIIDCLHEAGFSEDGIILNAGAYAHTSYAIADAISSVDAPVISVHISDIYARESFRHIDVLKDRCLHNIVGKGLDGYRLAVDYLLHLKR